MAKKKIKKIIKKAGKKAKGKKGFSQTRFDAMKKKVFGISKKEDAGKV
jgi:hypothetical protein